MFTTTRKLFAFLDPRSRVHMAVLLLPMLATAILEMASIGLILPVVQVLLLGEMDGTVTKALLAVLPEVSPERLPFWIAGTFAVLFLTKNICLLALIYVVNRVVFLKTAHFSARMYTLYLSRPMTFHFQRNSAEILRNLTTGCSLAFDALRIVLLMILDGLLMIAVFCMLLFAESVITLIVAATLIAIGLVFYRTTSPVFHYWGKRMMELEGALIQWINQSVASIRDIKLQHIYGTMSKAYSGYVEKRAAFEARSTTSMHIPRLVVETLVVIGFLMVVLALLAAEKPPGDVIGLLSLYGMAALRLMPSLNRILTSAAELRERTAYVDGLHQDLIEGALDTDRIALPETSPRLDYRRDITLEEIMYTYPDTVRHALRGINVSIKRGESVGFVGRSGAGKTTLIDIFLGLLRPQSGRLMVDGIDAFSNLRAWQQRIGYVPQQISLIDDSLKRNIAFGMPESDINEERVREVVSLARLDDIVSLLPDELSTVIGEGGARLSGGQRQRVAIARALYRNPDILVFDEATSELDNETERAITEAIENLAGDRTVLIIAHRLNTVQNCDKLVFMENGRVTAIGRFDELVANNADFRRLAQLNDIDTVARSNAPEA